MLARSVSRGLAPWPMLWLDMPPVGIQESDWHWERKSQRNAQTNYSPIKACKYKRGQWKNCRKYANYL